MEEVRKRGRRRGEGGKRGERNMEEEEEPYWPCGVVSHLGEKAPVQEPLPWRGHLRPVREAQGTTF